MIARRDVLSRDVVPHPACGDRPGQRLQRWAGHPLDALEGERLLLLQLLAAPFAAGKQLRVPVVGHRESAFCSLPALLHVTGGASDLLVGSLQEFRQGQLYVIGDPLYFGKTFSPRFLEERLQDVLLEPRCQLRPAGDLGQHLRNRGRREVAEHSRLAASRLAVAGQLQGEDPLMHHVAESVYDPGAVEVDAGRCVVRERMEAGAAG